MLAHDGSEPSTELPIAKDDPDLPRIQEILPQKEENPWRFKLGLLHRVCQKEILHAQVKHLSILHDILWNFKKATIQASATGRSLTKHDFKAIYLKPHGEFENGDEAVVQNRLVVRFYLMEFWNAREEISAAAVGLSDKKKK